MKPTGIIRQIDELGRIVLPVESRRLFNINPSDSVEISADDDGIILKPYNLKRCIFCGAKAALKKHIDKYICSGCISAVNVSSPLD